MPPQLILHPSQFPQEVIVDQEGLRKWNPQRFEMEQLNAITLLDDQQRLAVGYKDVREDEFWVRGHMPGYPLLPGVLMCEVGAQLSSYYCRHFGLMAGDFIGFGGMDNVRFRGTVQPGERLWVVGRAGRHSNRKMVFEIQEFVGENMVFNGEIIGVPITTSKS